MEDNIKIKEYIKNNYIFIIFGFALLTSVIFTGGLNWHSCIIPLILLEGCCLIKIKEIKNNAVIFSVLILLLTMVSLFYTKGDFQTGIYETEKLVLFITALLLGTTLRKKDILWSIYICAVVCALFGIFVYCGLLETGEYLLDDYGQIRLQSFFKYANTSACFLGMGYYSCIKIFSESKKQVHLYLGTIILIAMYLTVSKAVIPLFLIISLYYICKNREIAVMYVNSNGWALASVLLAIVLAEKHLYFAVFFVVAIGVMCAVNVKIIKKEINAIRLWQVMLIGGVILGIVLLILKPSFFTTFSQRLIYMKDSGKTIIDNIVFGSGPGSWRLLKYAFQSTGYNVIYMHSSLLQFVFENGIFFAIFVYGLAVKAIITTIKNKQHDFTAILLLLIVHSFVDFDLSFGAILIVLGTMCGSLCFNKNTKEKFKPIKVSIKAFIVILTCFCSVYMVTEYMVRTEFENKCIANQYESALNTAYKLEKICPRDSILQINIASLTEKTTKDVNEIKKRINKACYLSPNDTVIYEAYINYNMTRENIKDLCLKYVNMRPHFEGTHQAVKEFINKAYSSGLIDNTEKDELIKEMGDIRYDLKVYDRDELLDRIMNQRKNKKKGGK